MNVLTKQFQQKLSEMERKISRQSAVNESCLTEIAILEQKYLRLEEKNTILVDNLNKIQIKYYSFNSVLQNKTSELKGNLQELQQLKTIQQLQTVDDIQKKLQTTESLINSLRSQEQARNQDFQVLNNRTAHSQNQIPELYNLTTHYLIQIRDTNKMMSDRFNNVTVGSQNMISDLEKRTIDQFHYLEGHVYNFEKWQNDSVEQKAALSACVQSRTTVSPPTTIKFKNIITSKGVTDLASFKSRGIFVCEVPVLYLISVVIMSYTNQAYVVITKNNIELIKGNIDNYYTEHQNDYHSNAAIVVTELQKGDRIDIKPGNKDMYIFNENYSCITIVKVTC